MIICICGLVVESVADVQKNAAKKINPRRFVDTGLYKLVRCPNYLGEMIFEKSTAFAVDFVYSLARQVR